MSVDEKLVSEIAEEVWERLAGNGSLKIDIDTDVLWAYGSWDPHGEAEDEGDERAKRAQDWVEYFVRSALNRLAEHPDAGIWTRYKETEEDDLW